MAVSDEKDLRELSEQTDWWGFKRSNMVTHTHTVLVLIGSFFSSCRVAEVLRQHKPYSRPSCLDPQHMLLGTKNNPAESCNSDRHTGMDG